MGRCKEENLSTALKPITGRVSGELLLPHLAFVVAFP